MSPQLKSRAGHYTLATGSAAVRRLQLLHKIYSPAGRRVLLRAGIQEGMNVADFGCGVGVVTSMLAGMVGTKGHVTGVDLDAAQLEQASLRREAEHLTNTSFVHASACETGLPDESFDLVYCRFLLIHLTDPAACLAEMRRVLKPGAIVVIEDGDLSTVGSVPPTALNAFAELYCELGAMRGVDYTLGRDLYGMVQRAGFTNLKIEIHQPAEAQGDTGRLTMMSFAEAGPAMVAAGLITETKLRDTLEDMEDTLEDPDVLALAPRMSLVWGHKPA